MSDLREIVRQLSRPLDPQPTGVAPRLPRLEGIRAVVFDVYGTLLVSGSGDISLASETGRGDAALEALRAVDCELVAAATGEAIVERLHEEVHAAHARSKSKHPEVEIRELWRAVLESLGVALDAPSVERLAVEYECRVNPIWPAPAAAECLSALRGAGIRLGIVSNAQFFTPVAMEALLGESLADLGFDERLLVWSFAHREAKPGAYLYERAAEALAGLAVAPAETLYVGNDMRNDVAPAARLGFRTALFAGDARSLRLREGDPLVAGVEPDAVVTQLLQISTVLSLAGG